MIAGVTVACVALPLSLAIALASEVEPAAGLVTAIVAGIVCALFGGTPLAVSGPAAAMAVIVAAVVETHGRDGLLLVVLGCGVLQLVTGALGLGRYIRLVPLPVVEGFTAGIGAIILIGQLPRVLGLPAPEQSHVADVVLHIADLLHRADPVSILLAVSTLSLVLGLPRIDPRIPAPLIAIALPTIVVAALGVDTALIGAIPRAFSAPTLPSLPNGGLLPLAGSTIAVFAIASLETLLSSSAVDKLAGGTRHDPDQELVGQGLGNFASALFRGIAVTGVIVRSALNLQAGAKTRRASIVHALVLVLAVLFFAPALERIPVAALAGLLVAIALRMLKPRTVVDLYRVAPGDALVLVVTFVVIVFTDLLEGVQWGLVAALAIAAVRMGQTRLSGTGGAQARLAVRGPLTFLASLAIEKLRERVELLPHGGSLVLDLSEVTFVDASGVEMITDLVRAAKQRGIRVALFGLNPETSRQVLAADTGGVLGGVLAPTEQDVDRVTARSPDGSARDRLARGVERYQRDRFPSYSGLFERLAIRQTPHTLLVTCSDSRIQTGLITSTDPGELFIVRNVGNMVPPYTAAMPTSPGAAIEYAVGLLGVSQVVVCAHSGCGAIEALRHPERIPPELAALHAWLGSAETRHLCDALPRGMASDEVARLNALLQVDHLKTFPVVREKMEAGAIGLVAWFFDVGTGEIEEWDAATKTWRPVASRGGEQPPSTKAGAPGK